MIEKKKMLMFYQPMCPFCKRAFQFIEELKAENKEFAEIEIEGQEKTALHFHVEPR